jgi:hypothetical protein
MKKNFSYQIIFRYRRKFTPRAKFFAAEPRLSSRSSGALLNKQFSSASGAGRKDKALMTMPSRLRDKSGHRRKAFLPAPLVKSIQVVATKWQ